MDDVVVAFTKEAQRYELSYWNAHRGEVYSRAEVMRSMFDEWPIDGVVADVGCGPYGGVFHTFSYPRMFAIDPLWPKYHEAGLVKVQSGVVQITSSAESFELPEKADVIFSINALDHSGNIGSSIRNIMENLKPNGTFFFHVHMRTNSQLNTGHTMVVTESIIDDLLSPYDVAWRTVLDTCPLDMKARRTYIARICHAC